jgi:chemotaxis response regulator CheB
LRIAIATGSWRAEKRRCTIGRKSSQHAKEVKKRGRKEAGLVYLTKGRSEIKYQAKVKLPLRNQPWKRR